jgi:hypothetical protein
MKRGAHARRTHHFEQLVQIETEGDVDAAGIRVHCRDAFVVVGIIEYGPNDAL